MKNKFNNCAFYARPFASTVYPLVRKYNSHIHTAAKQEDQDWVLVLIGIVLIIIGYFYGNAINAWLLANILWFL